MRIRHACTLCVLAVAVSTELSYGSSSRFGFLELSVRACIGNYDGFDVEDSREMYTRQVSMAGKELGTIGAERFDMDEKFALSRWWDG